MFLGNYANNRLVCQFANPRFLSLRTHSVMGKHSKGFTSSHRLLKCANYLTRAYFVNLPNFSWQHER